MLSRATHMLLRDIGCLRSQNVCNLAAPPISGTGSEDYSGRNFIRCQPGSLTKLDDGRMYRCQ